jgi:hypothetical protein
MKRLLIALALVMACRGQKREDVRAIVRAYEAFQSAGQADRRAALASLEAAPCNDTPTCKDRDACVGYARSLTRAQELTRKAQELAPEDAGGNGAATPAELSIIIGGADDATKEATAAEPACRSALDRLYALAR